MPGPGCFGARRFRGLRPCAGGSYRSPLRAIGLHTGTASGHGEWINSFPGGAGAVVATGLRVSVVRDEVEAPPVEEARLGISRDGGWELARAHQAAQAAEGRLAYPLRGGMEGLAHVLQRRDVLQPHDGGFAGD